MPPLSGQIRTDHMMVVVRGTPTLAERVRLAMALLDGTGFCVRLHNPQVVALDPAPLDPVVASIPYAEHPVPQEKQHAHV